LFEEHLYWLVVFSRWVEPANWPVTRKAFFGNVPILLRGFVASIIQKKMLKYLHAQGAGRHRPEEVYQLGIDDLQALNTFLNEHQFLLRDVPTSIDACGYAFLANILEPPIASPLQDYAKSQPNIVRYCAQMKERFY